MTRDHDAVTADLAAHGSGEPHDHQSSWLDEVNKAMRLPPVQGRAVLDSMISQRRRRAAELRARVASDQEDPRQKGVFALMAAWVDDSIGLLEQARAHLGRGQASGADGVRGGETAVRASPTRPRG